MNDDERSGLVDLITRTSEIIEWAIRDHGSKVPEYLREPLASAWVSVTRERFNELATRIASGTYDVELEAHGLSDSELRAKLVAFDAYYLAWSDLRDRTNGWRFRRPKKKGSRFRRVRPTDLTLRTDVTRRHTEEERDSRRPTRGGTASGATTSRGQKGGLVQDTLESQETHQRSCREGIRSR